MPNRYLLTDYSPAEIATYLATSALRGLLKERRRLATIVRRADQLDTP